MQEMVVPVIEYHYLHNDSMEYKRNKQKYDTKPVTVNLLSANRKISNVIFSLNFYQKDAVGANREAATYQVYFTDENGNSLSVAKKGGHTIIDMVTVRLDMKKDCFFAEFSNLGVGNVPIADEYPEKFDRLLCGGIWCIVQLDYEVEGDNNFGIEDIDGNPLRSKQKKQKDISPISIRKLTPIQMPHVDIDELKQGRKAFTKDEWLDILLRSIGMEPDEFTYREKRLLLTRMIPLVENNFNLCELGPRSTGKSHLYKEISPNNILISGGQTTVANLFYNMGRKTVGLVGLWDCVAFDEVAGIRFKDKDGIQIMKDYMASGSFARGMD